MIPRKWTMNDALDLPPLPMHIAQRKFCVKLDGREFDSVSAVDEDEGWIEVIARDYDGKPMLHDGDAVRVILRGVVEQSE